MFRSPRRRAKRGLGLATVTDAHPGAVAAVWRADSALRMNVHCHVLALDGVYVRNDTTGSLVFHPLPAPTQAEVAEVARRTAARIEQLLRKHGRSIDPELADDDPHPLDLDDPALAACYAAAARGLGISRCGALSALRRSHVESAPVRRSTPGSPSTRRNPGFECPRSQHWRPKSRSLQCNCKALTHTSVAANPTRLRHGSCLVVSRCVRRRAMLVWDMS
jgi:hypothetical protein